MAYSSNLIHSGNLVPYSNLIHSRCLVLSLAWIHSCCVVLSRNKIHSLLGGTHRYDDSFWMHGTRNMWGSFPVLGTLNIPESFYCTCSLTIFFRDRSLYLCVVRILFFLVRCYLCFHTVSTDISRRTLLSTFLAVKNLAHFFSSLGAAASSSSRAIFWIIPAFSITILSC